MRWFVSSINEIKLKNIVLARALESEVPETTAEEPLPVSVELKEETGPGNVPILFAAENFPQPPESGAVSEEKPKKQNKFDEKVEKLGADETVIYDDNGQIAEQTPDETSEKIESEDNLSDVRVPQEQDQNEDYKIFDKEPEQSNPETIENQESKTDYDFESVTESTYEPVEVTPPTPPTEATEDPKEAEIRRIKAEMERLEAEVKQIKGLFLFLL